LPTGSVDERALRDLQAHRSLAERSVSSAGKYLSPPTPNQVENQRSARSGRPERRGAHPSSDRRAVGVIRWFATEKSTPTRAAQLVVERHHERDCEGGAGGRMSWGVTIESCTNAVL
jgi:hypothetical protein